jgi:hypothetical protein
MYIITINFIIGLLEVASTATPWQLDSFNTYNALIIITDKSLKRALLIPGYNTYTAID